MKCFRFLFASLFSMALVSVALASPQNELLEKRTAMSKTFDNGNGTFTLQTSTSPIHYQDTRSSWQEVNASVVSQKGSYEWGCTTNGLRSFFSSSLSSGVRVEAQPDFWLNLWPSGLFLQFADGRVEKYEDCKVVSPVVSGNKVLYRGVYSFVDQAYEVESYALRLQLIINDLSQGQRAELARAEYLKVTFHLERHENTSVWEGSREYKNGFVGSQLDFRDGEAQEAFSFEALRVQGRADALFDLKYSVEQLGNETQLSVLLPTRSLLSKGNNFPLIIDAVVNLYCPDTNHSCSVVSYENGSQYSLSRTGTPLVGGLTIPPSYPIYYYRAGLQWGWSNDQLPDGSVINDVGLHFYVQNGNGISVANLGPNQTVDLTSSYWDTHPQELFVALSNWNRHFTTRTFPSGNGWVDISSLGSAAVNWLQQMLPYHRFTLGFVGDPEVLNVSPTRIYGSASPQAYLSVTFTPSVVRVTVRNHYLGSNPPFYGDSVFIDNTPTPILSPAFFDWTAGQWHNIGAKYVSPYLSAPNPRYFCDWTDVVPKDRRINVSIYRNLYEAEFKERPLLTGWQSYPTNYLNWSWRPSEARPVYLGSFDACYWKGSFLGPDLWSHFQWFNVTTNSTPDAVRVDNPTNTYLIKAHMQSGSDTNDVWSNPFSTTAPPPGDPLIAHSNDSLATGFPNGQKIALDLKDRLHVVFASGDTVYYSKSNKKAKKWSLPVAVGLGKFPAIAMDSRENPHVLWTSGTQVLSSQLSNGNWTTPYSLFSSSGATVEAPSFVINTANDSGFASWTVVTTTSSEVSLASFMPGDTTAPVSIQRVDSGGTTSFASPSLILDPTGKVLVSWSRDGEVYFQERGGTMIDLSQSSELSIHPVVDAFGERVTVTWQEQDASGAFRILRVMKVGDIWGAPWDLGPGSGSAVYPAVAGASQIVFSTDAPGRREVFYNGLYEDGGWLYTTLLSVSSEGSAHNYPSIVLDNDWPKATLHAVWTSEVPLVVPPRAIKTIAIEVPPVPSVFVDVGQSQPSSRTVQRGGFQVYGNLPFMTADTHPQKLIYRFTGLNPNKRYRLGVTYYFEKPGETWRMRLVVDGRDGMRTRIPTNTRVDDSDWLPRSVYQDGVIDVEITPLEGDFALCNEIALYEFDRGKGGGPQEEEGWSGKPLPLTYALGQSYPNPFKDNVTIAYQLPEEVPVSLKVFNVTGQVVRELASGKQKAGFYNAVWDGKDGSGRSVSSGIYFYRLDAGGFTKTNKLVVVR